MDTFERILLAAMTDDLPIGFAVFDRRLKFLRVNKVLAAINGASVEEHIGKHVAEVAPALVGAAATFTDRIERTGAPVFNEEFSGEAPIGSGSIRYWRESWFPLRNMSGELIGYWATFFDITELRKSELLYQNAQAALQVAEASRARHADRLELAMDVVRLGWWDLDCTKTPHQQIWNAERSRQFGLAPRSDGKASLEDWANQLHPEDKEQAIAAYNLAIATGESYTHEYRIQRADNGEERWLRSIAKFYKGNDGKVERAVGASLDITDQKRCEIELRAAVYKLGEADRMKNEFLAMLAHELRNPLAPIRNAVSGLKLAGPKDPLLVELRDIIDRQVSHLSRLVDDLIDVARVSSGAIALRKTKISIDRVLRDAVELAERHMRDKGQVFCLDVTGPLAPINGDATRLTQAIGQLLLNASKYTDRGGTVVLKAEVADGQLVITVRDTGVGISHEFLPRVFDIFSQEHQTLDRSQGGLGIGLSLVKRIVDLHSGTVTAESEGIGRGATLTIRLPLSEQPALTSAGKRTVVSGGKRLRVVVVDDDPDQTRTLGAVLELHGHEVRQANDGRQALDLVRLFDPDVVITDIEMPGLTGLDIARQTRESSSRPRLLIALSGYGGRQDRLATAEAGFDHHLVKPVSTETILGLLSETGLQANIG